MNQQTRTLKNLRLPRALSKSFEFFHPSPLTEKPNQNFL